MPYFILMDTNKRGITEVVINPCNPNEPLSKGDFHPRPSEVISDLPYLSKRMPPFYQPTRSILAYIITRAVKVERCSDFVLDSSATHISSSSKKYYFFFHFSLFLVIHNVLCSNKDLITLSSLNI